MRNVAIVVVVLVVLLVIVLVVLAGRRNKRRAALRERFGPEYDVAVKRGKDRRAVEQRLQALAEQRDRLDIREVEPTEYERFARQWDSAQARFVDDPGQAVADADGLVNSVLRSRGYPTEGFDDRAALVATDHQDVVEGYRSAHDTYAAHLQGGSADTEQLRKAFLDYRELFGRLNVPAGDGSSDGLVDRPVDEVAGRSGEGGIEAVPPAVVAGPVEPPIDRRAGHSVEPSVEDRVERPVEERGQRPVEPLVESRGEHPVERVEERRVGGASASDATAVRVDAAEAPPRTGSATKE